MPNLTFYISQQHAGRLTDLHDLTRACSALCTGILAAESENVHIIYVEVKPGCGHPVYAELFYRLTSERTPEVMAEFMRELERTIREASGLTARIRCFGSAASHLFARN
ncbi:hypothetical protein [Raoultella planticola]|jgi:hypothetical protein|uniref:hypothetical protein n=1 Tax=Raoultella planticola TaxID=575 RepID=UPI00045B8F3F|nr:hypothetical protein [Raoultella planticola]AUU06479.1 hypothetical protein MC50_022885 [Raoultella planticola]EKW5592206.1 hypothetical protein [Raoultella planticola]KAJ96559.1 hypothetical protein DF41_05130 [Raoultella planticola]MDV1189359.1 hypothetical protein [Raoultella planticola]PNK80677.1 hypothetical protein CEP62_022595 [Raoultella planticola]